MSTATPTISLCNQKNRITTELPNGNENFEEDDTIMTKEFICSRAVRYRRIFIKSVLKLIKHKKISTCPSVCQVLLVEFIHFETWFCRIIKRRSIDIYAPDIIKCVLAWSTSKRRCFTNHTGKTSLSSCRTWTECHPNF